MTYENDPEGIAVNFRAVGKALSKATSCNDTEQFFEDHWKDEIEEYRKKSQKKSVEEK